MLKTWLRADEADKHFSAFQAARWHDYRRIFPSRPHTKQLVFTSNPRPDKNLQLPWHVYERKNEKEGLVQQWVLLPTLVPVVERTQPLAGASGASPETRLCGKKRAFYAVPVVDNFRKLESIFTIAIFFATRIESHSLGQK